ncbi:cytochrome c-type biogenesis protein CcmH [Candidatus Poriferisodalis sp.]|uniref:cytochrome c-type biogenesis protein CcmH n=1 Tax=Candidatus Poriferisodalis sp. TaxID=3101277 RepID=UPI003B01E3ED
MSDIGASSPAPPTRGGPGLRRIGWLAIAVVAVIAAVLAATSSRPPATEAERAYELKEATLCPVCDGQSVLESNAPAAAAMRRQIDLWVSAGRSDAEIRADLAAAYGDDVNALPPGEGVGTLVWALPVAAFAAAAAGLWAATRRWKARASAVDADGNLSDGDGVEEAVGAGGNGADGDGSTAAVDPNPPGSRDRRSGWRSATVVTVSGLVLVGAVAGVLVARSAGLRLSGETLTGDIDRSARSLLVDAQRQFAANQLDESRATLEEIFRLDPDLRGALVLSARLHLRHCESASSQDPSGAGEATDAPAAGCDLQSALVDLDRVLADDPSDTEALALRGWLLVRIPDRELIVAGIASLDAAVALDPGEFDPWVFRGYTARFIERDLEAAIGYYGAALQRNPPPAMAAALETAITEMQAELE